MSTGPLEARALPPAAVELLDAFRERNPGTPLRIWTGGAEKWECLYPNSGDAPPAPAQKTLRPLDGTRPDTLALELGAEDATAASILATALSAILAYDEEARSAARELAERYEEINLLYTISEVLGSVLSLDTAARRILTEVTEVMGAKRASLWVHDRTAGVLRLAGAVGEEGLTGPIPVDDHSSVTANVFRERQPMNLERGSAPPRGTRLEPRPHGSEPFLSVPINFTPPEGAARTVGVITLVGHRTDVRFSAGDVRLLSAIASQVGAALETHRLVAEGLRRERVVRELELAHDLQLKLLPQPTGFEPTAQVAARCAPADSVGGDFYHLFRLSDQRLGVVIGDVSGHGFGAALIMALTMSAVGIYAREAGPPGEVMRRLHGALIDELETTEMHLTIFYGVLDLAAGELAYANAGHPHAFVIRGAGAVERLAATDPPLGTLPLHPQQEGRVSWERGRDLLCLFTDGLSDAFAEGEEEGEQTLVARVSAMRDRPPAEILECLFRAAGTAKLHVPPDDRTAVLLRG